MTLTAIGKDYREIPEEILKNDGKFLKVSKIGKGYIIRCVSFSKMKRFNELMAKHQWPTSMIAKHQKADTIVCIPLFTKINIKRSKQCGAITALEHCECGPARYYDSGRKPDYFLEGRMITKEQWQLKMKKVQIDRLRKMK
jgi:hypothetical protein